MIGNAKVMSYDDMVETQKKRDAREGGRVLKRSRAQEVAKAEQEINTVWFCNLVEYL
jgi:hypothetical protein